MKNLTKHLKNNDLMKMANDLVDYFDTKQDFINEVKHYRDDVLGYPITWHKAGEVMVEYGNFAVYYDDQREYLKNIYGQSDAVADSFTNDQVFKRYQNLVGRVINALMTGKIKI